MKVAIQPTAATGMAASAIAVEIMAAMAPPITIWTCGGWVAKAQVGSAAQSAARPTASAIANHFERERIVRLPARRAASIALRHETQLAKATSATQPTTQVVSTEPYIAQPTISAAQRSVTMNRTSATSRALVVSPAIRRSSCAAERRSRSG